MDWQGQKCADPVLLLLGYGLACRPPISEYLVFVSPPFFCREVQLDLTPEIEVFHMLFARCHTKHRKRSTSTSIYKTLISGVNLVGPCTSQSVGQTFFLYITTLRREFKERARAFIFMTTYLLPSLGPYLTFLSCKRGGGGVKKLGKTLILPSLLSCFLSFFLSAFFASSNSSEKSSVRSLPVHNFLPAACGPKRLNQRVAKSALRVRPLSSLKADLQKW